MYQEDHPFKGHDVRDIHMNVTRMEIQKPYFDPWYLATIPGGLKVIHVVSL